MKEADEIVELRKSLLELEKKYGQLQHAYTILEERNEELKAGKNVLVETILDIETKEKKYKKIIENSPGALFLTKPDGTILEANKTACDMFGYSELEFKQMGRQGFIDHADTNFKKLFNERKRNGKVSGEVTVIKKDGGRMQAEVSSFIFKDLVTGEECTSTVMTDISDRIKIEKALLDSERNYRDLFNLNPLPMWIYDCETNGFIAVNEVAMIHYGYTRDEFLQMSIADIRPDEEKERLQRFLSKGPGESKTYGGYWKHRKKNGEIIQVEIISQLISYTGRKARLVLSNDVTDKLRKECQLIKSNQRLQTAQQIAQLGYWELNLATLEVYLSEQSYVILGLEPTDKPITYEAFFRMIHPEDKAHFIEKQKAVVSGQKTVSVEHRIILHNGVIKTMQEIGNLIYNEAGVAVFFEGTVQDITERKKTQEELSKSLEWSNLVFNSTTDLMFLMEVTSDGDVFRCLKVNPAYIELTGLTARQLIGKSIEEILPHEPAQFAISQYRKAIQKKCTIVYEEDIHLPDKHIIVETKLTPVFSDAGEAILLLGVARNITDRKRTEIELSKERNQLRILINTLPDSIYIKDIQGRKMVTNHVDRQLMGGVSEADAIGKTDLDIFPNKSGADSYSDDREVLETGKSIFNREECFLDQNGAETWLLTSKVPIRNEAGEINGLLGIGRIITERKQAEEALRKSNERYLYATKATFDAIWDWDIVNDYLFWGEGYEKIFGYKTAGKIENHIHSFDNIHPEDRKFVFDSIDKLLAGNEVNWASEYRYKKANGVYANVQDKGIIIRDQNGTAVRMIGAMQDVTERKMAEEAVKRTQDKFTSLVNTIDGIVWEADAQTFAFTYVSQHAEKLLGYPVSLWTSDPMFWPHHIHPDDRNWAVDYCHTYTRKQEKHQFEYRMIAADGSVVWLADFVTIVVENKETVQLRGIMIDITERKKMEEALIKERKLLRLLIDNLPDYIYVKDKELKHIINNKANIRLLGFQSEEQTINKTIVELLGEEIGREFLKDDLMVLQTGQPIINREEPIHNSNGETHWLLTTKIPFNDDNNIITGLVGISRDITERKKTDEELTEKNRQLKNLSKHLQNIREEERKILAREVHDELGQLASVVKMDIDWLMLRLPNVEEAPRKRIQHASSMAELLINTIRKIASTLRPGMLDELGLNASLAWQCKEFTSLNGIPCVFEQLFDDEHLSMELKTELFRICQESLTNVMRHAAATQVWVTINDTKEGLRLRIADNGKGFDTSLKKNTLGLIGMRERALSINGRLTIESKEGKGTTIDVMIPNYIKSL